MFGVRAPIREVGESGAETEYEALADGSASRPRARCSGFPDGGDKDTAIPGRPLGDLIDPGYQNGLRSVVS